MENAIRLIITKSPNAAHEAINTLRALRANSPIVKQRYARTLEIALQDSGATFTSEDRLILADVVQLPDGARSFMLRVRLTETEQAQLSERADDAGQSMSEYARRKMFSAD